ncbi:hypothetical protein B0H12DRAFT_1308059 [Mycena haematopus]|nr:hypothetical protein B0H12DRAFT_1308059 [Mycena haematopus]
MSFWLPPRGGCLVCPCQATFFASPEGRKPQLHTDPCVCGHSYTSHRLPATLDPENVNHTRIRGANLSHHCGGFIAPQIPAWEFTTSCVACNAPWYHHSDFEMDPLPMPHPAIPLHNHPSYLPSDPFPRPPAFRFPPPDPFPRPPAVHLPPLANIFQSSIPPASEYRPGNPIPMSFQRPQPDRGTIQAMRERSRLDNLPQHNSERPGPVRRGTSHSNVASGSSSLGAPNPFAMVAAVRSGSSSGKKKKKKSKAQDRAFLICFLPFTHGRHEAHFGLVWPLCRPTPTRLCRWRLRIWGGEGIPLTQRGTLEFREIDQETVENGSLSPHANFGLTLVTVSADADAFLPLAAQDLGRGRGYL